MWLLLYQISVSKSKSSEIPYPPIQRRLFDKNIHGAEQQIGIISQSSQHVPHGALHLSIDLQRHVEVHKLSGQSEWDQLRQGQELEYINPE